VTSPHRPAITLTYCTQCNWLLRSGWMAQELLSTFGQDLASVTLVPSTGGVFRVEIDGTCVWDRVAQGGFPDAKTLKRLVRDVVWVTEARAPRITAPMTARGTWLCPARR
jgi:selenoprotein W-related protein